MLAVLVGMAGAGASAGAAAANDEIATLEAAGGRVTVLRLGRVELH